MFEVFRFTTDNWFFCVLQSMCYKTPRGGGDACRRKNFLCEFNYILFSFKKKKATVAFNGGIQLTVTKAYH